MTTHEAEELCFKFSKRLAGACPEPCPDGSDGRVRMAFDNAQMHSVRSENPRAKILESDRRRETWESGTGCAVWDPKLTHEGRAQQVSMNSSDEEVLARTHGND